MKDRLARLVDRLRSLHESARDDADVTALLAEANELLEAELSHDEIRRSLTAAVKAGKPSGNGYYCWVRDVFDDYLVYEEETPTGTTLWRQGYAIDDAGSVTLGSELTKVKVATTYVEVSESGTAREPDDLEEAELVGEIVPLVEKAVRKDGSFPIRVIAPGWGSSGYYSEAVLKRDIPKVFPKGTHMHFDHPTATESKERPERSVRTIAAVTTSTPVWQQDGPAGPGMYAEAKARSAYRADIEELAPHIGVSIVASGVRKTGVAEGRKGPVIEAIHQGQSIDFVTQAGAGGQVISLFEAARSRAASEPLEEGEDPVSEQELKEARDALAAAQRERDEALAEIARHRQGELMREARDVAAAVLAKVESLPAMARDLLLERVARDPSAHITDGKLDRAAYETAIAEAVKAEVEYLAKVTGSGQIRGMGGAAGSDTQVKEAEDRLEAALGRGFGLSEAAAKIAAGGRH